jgi:hypothetical protein
VANLVFAKNQSLLISEWRVRITLLMSTNYLVGALC